MNAHFYGLTVYMHAYHKETMITEKIIYKDTTTIWMVNKIAKDIILTCPI